LLKAIGKTICHSASGVVLSGSLIKMMMKMKVYVEGKDL
jgi:hypothetical protein